MDNHVCIPLVITMFNKVLLEEHCPHAIYICFVLCPHGLFSLLELKDKILFCSVHYSLPGRVANYEGAGCFRGSTNSSIGNAGDADCSIKNSFYFRHMENANCFNVLCRPSAGLLSKKDASEFLTPFNKGRRSFLAKLLFSSVFIYPNIRILQCADRKKIQFNTGA